MLIIYWELKSRMDLQFYGANTISINFKDHKFVFDDNLNEIGLDSVTKASDVAFFTGQHQDSIAHLVFDSAGEFEISAVSVIGLPAAAYLDVDGKTTMFKIILNDLTVLITGNINPNIPDYLLEEIGLIDVLMMPVGGLGLMLDPVQALKVIKAIEPKIFIPTYYQTDNLKYKQPHLTLDNIIEQLGLEVKSREIKLKLRPSELTDKTQLVILEKV